MTDNEFDQWFKGAFTDAIKKATDEAINKAMNGREYIWPKFEYDDPMREVRSEFARAVRDIPRDQLYPFGIDDLVLDTDGVYKVLF